MLANMTVKNEGNCIGYHVYWPDYNGERCDKASGTENNRQWRC